MKKKRNKRLIDRLIPLCRHTLAFLLAVMFLFAQLSPLPSMKVKAAGGRPLSPIAAFAEDSTYHAPHTKEYQAVTTNGEKVRIIFYRDDMFRIWLANDGDGEFSESDSDVLLAKTDFGSTPEVTLADKEGWYELATSQLTLRAYKNPFRFEVFKDGEKVWGEAGPISYDTNAATQTLDTDAKEYFFGGGMQMGSLSHKGKKISLARGSWTPGNAPNPVPFYMSTKGFGVLRNTYNAGTYDFTSSVSTQHMHREPRFDAFYFYGPSFATILDRYTELTGRPSLIPRWAIGLGDAGAYRQPKDGTGKGSNPGDSSNYKPESDPYGGFWRDNATVGVVSDAQTAYLDKDMPVSWMLPNDGYGCEYNKATHPGGSLGAAGKGLLEKGVRLGLWIGQPGNYTAANYTYGDGTDAGFTKEITAQVKDWGVRMYKIDVAWSSKYALKGDITNIYRRLYNNLETNANERGFLVTVFAGAGAQRYATIWSGDQSGSDDYVQYHIPSFTGASMSGFPYSTSDQGAIFTDNPNIYVRDLQMKTLVPTNYAMNNWGRFNSARVNTADKRPASSRFTEQEREISRKYLLLKSQLVPYMYSYARQSYDTGAAIVRPMVYNYQDDPVTYDTRTQHQYMSGDWLLAAPAYDPSAAVRDNIYLPQGRWIDYWSGEEYFGPTTISVPAPIDKLPLFVRSGAIIPMAQEHLTDDQVTYKGKTVRDTLILDLYPEGKTSFDLYEDDGHSIKYKTENAYTHTLITSDAPAAGVLGALTVTIGAAKGNAFEGQMTERKNLLMIHTATQPGFVKLEGKELPVLKDYAAIDSTVSDEAGGWFFDPDEKGGLLYVKTPSRSTNAATTIQVGRYKTNVAPELELALELVRNVKAEGKSRDSIEVTWDVSDGADVYDLEIDGQTMKENLPSGSYLLTGVEDESSHTFRVRARNTTQKSGWTPPVTGESLGNPDHLKIPLTVSNLLWTGGDAWGALKNAVDGNPSTFFHSTTGKKELENFDINLGGLYTVDKLTYLPRQDNGGNGNIRKYEVLTSVDGTVWTTAAEGTWSVGDSPEGLALKTVSFTPTLAGYVRLRKIDSVGGFISIAELNIYRTDKDIVMSSITAGKKTTASSVWRPEVLSLEPVAGVSASAENYESAGGFMPSQAVDGNGDTLWKTRAGSKLPAALDIYMPGNSVKEICGLTWYPPRGAAAGSEGNVTGYAVYVTDASNRKVWVAGGNWTDDGTRKTVRFRPVRAKAVHFTVTAGTGGKGAASEIEVLQKEVDYQYREDEIDRQSADAVWTAAYGNGALMSAADSGANASNAIDGNPDTFNETSYRQSDWNTTHWPAYFTVDLKVPKVVSKIQYLSRKNASGSLRSYEVYYSTDGVDFYKGGSGITSGPANSEYEELNFEYRYPVRYLRIATAFNDSLINDPTAGFVGHSKSSHTMFGWKVGNHMTMSDLKVWEDTQKTAEAPKSPVTIRKVETADGLTVAAVSSGDSSKHNILDGQADTCWESESEAAITAPGKWPAYAVFDLGEERVINKIQYQPGKSSNGRLRGYEVLWSNDGTNFTHDSYGYGWDNANIQIVPFKNRQPVRYIKIQNAVFGTMIENDKLSFTDTVGASEGSNNGARAYGSGNHIAIAGMEFYEELGSSSDPSFGEPEAGYAAEYATDTSLDTGWSSDETAAAAELVVDLGAVQTLDYAKVVWGQQIGRNFTIDTSENGINWTTQKTVTGNTMSSVIYSLGTKPVTAQYIRLSGTEGTNGYTIRSFDVFGPVQVDDVRLEQEKADLDVGRRLALKAEVVPGTARNQTLLWSSDREEVAVVNANGVVTAKAPGTAVITAESEDVPGKKATCTVTVHTVNVTSVELDVVSSVMARGTMTQLEATVLPADVTNQGIVWSSQNTKVATVTPYGFVTAKEAGTTTITAASAADGTKKAVLKLTVTDLLEVRADNDAGTLEVFFREMPDKILKNLFEVNYSLKGSAEEHRLDLADMILDSAKKRVTFHFETIDDSGTDGIVFKIRYKSGSTLIYSTEQDYRTLTYTVTLDPNGGTVSKKAITVKAGEAIGKLPRPSRSGYKFKGWYHSKTGGTRITDTTKVTRNMTAFAQWVAVPHAVGTQFDSGNYKYKVVKKAAASKNGSVQVVGLADTHKGTGKLLTKINIPKITRLGVFTYNVESIKKNAFKNNKKITEVVVGGKVKTIGDGAFSGCSKLKSVTISKNVINIGKKVFYNDKMLKTVTVKSEKLNKVGRNTFKNINKNAKIKVPAAKLDRYKKLLKKGQGKTVVIMK